MNYLLPWRGLAGFFVAGGAAVLAYRGDWLAAVILAGTVLAAGVQWFAGEFAATAAVLRDAAWEAPEPRPDRGEAVAGMFRVIADWAEDGIAGGEPPRWVVARQAEASRAIAAMVRDGEPLPQWVVDILDLRMKV